MQRETKKMFRVALLMILSLTISITVVACDLCGCFVGVLPYDNQSSFGISHRYRIYSGYPNYSGGNVFPQGAYRLSNPSVLHGTHTAQTISADDFESYKVIELRGKWFIHPRLELNFILPFSENRESRNGVNQKANGFGDASIFAGYHLIKKADDSEFRHRMVIGLGLKFPTGNCSSKTSDGERISLMLQTGTGSTDGIIYLAYIGGGYNFRWGTTLSGKLNGTNKYQERFSPSFSNSGFVGYLLTFGNWKVLPQVSAFHEHTDGILLNGQKMDGTRMSSVMLGPSVDLFYKNFSVTTGFQVPVYQFEQAFDLLNKAKLSIGLTWAFNQKNYLINSLKKS